MDADSLSRPGSDVDCGRASDGALLETVRGLRALKKWSEAEALLLERLTAERSALLLCELGRVRHAAGRAKDALADFRDAIGLRPESAETQYYFGNALRDSGQTEAAAAAFERATVLQPDLAEAHNNLGNLRLAAGDPDAALAHYDRALAVRPGLVDAAFNRGNALAARHRHNEALAAFAATLARAPGHAGAYNNAGEVLAQLFRLPEAARCYAEAVARDPTLPQPRRNLASLHMEQGRPGEAVPLLEQALALEPDSAETLGLLLHCKLHCCAWADLENLLDRLRRALQKGGVLPPFIGSTLPLSSAEQTATATRWAARFTVMDRDRLPPPSRPSSSGPIRLGYLSGDFHAHATAFLTAELFERHDRSGFRVIGYSFGPDDGSAMRRRLATAFDDFVDLRGLTDRGAAERIRADGIDILVDLKGYTAGARTRILAFRPAPIQVNWLGFPGSMGADFIDYVVADRIVAPEVFQQHCLERIAALPDCFQPNDRQRSRPGQRPARAPLGLPEHGFVFCSFNTSYKITPDRFDLWMRLLAQVPGSVLWLFASNGDVAGNLTREAAVRGIDAERLVFASRLPLEAHMARLAAADLFLDTLPVNALTTASDALWAGVPVLTQLGATVAGRGCASLLHAVGLPELVMPDALAYAATALRLARNPAALAALRARLAVNRDRAPLFDTPRFAYALEALYRRMADRARAGLPPAVLEPSAAAPWS